MWKELIDKALGALKIEGIKALLHQLETFVHPYAVKAISSGVGAYLLTGVDAVIAASVNALDKEHAGEFAHAYVEQIDHEVTQITAALTAYIPLQFAVEEAKKEFGAGSPEEKAALEKRAAGIETIRQDISELFADLFPK